MLERCPIPLRRAHQIHPSNFSFVMTEPTSAEFESTPDEIEMSAYLDGELAASDAQRVEQKMADDEQYRQQLHSMQRAWDMLDELPTADVDDSFAQTTVEMISLAASTAWVYRVPPAAPASME